MATQAVFSRITCAVEVFLATATLHRDQPARPDFLIQEIVQKAVELNLGGEIRSGVSVHASQHCVANRAPNPAKLRMLYATGKHTRRLFLAGDKPHSERTGKIFPDPGEVPEKYLPLLEWARARYESSLAAAKDSSGGARNPDHSRTEDSSSSAIGAGESAEPPRRHLEDLLQARGIGAHLANGIDPDDYIRELREGWE